MLRFLRRSGGSNNSGLYAHSSLSRLDFSSFQRCVWLWLGASGYKHMRFCGRRSQRGRAAAGPDFIVRTGDDGIDMAVQVRHWKSPVSKRAVDELRGVMLRYSLPAGMIVASSPCSRAARFAAMDFPGRAIKIVGIDRLHRSFENLGIELDDRFFAMIEQFSLGFESANRAAHKARRFAIEGGSEVEFGNSGPNLPLVIAALLILVAVILAAGGLVR